MGAMTDWSASDTLSTIDLSDNSDYRNLYVDALMGARSGTLDLAVETAMPAQRGGPLTPRPIRSAQP